jgi:hypothetical protein
MAQNFGIAAIAESLPESASTLRHAPDVPTPAAPRSQPAQGQAGHFLWLMVPLVYALVAWSLGGEYLVSHRLQQAIEVGGILATGAVGLLLAQYVRSRNMQVERAYSAHLEELSQKLRSLAYRDSLTELYNHRYFHEQLSHEVERANRYGHSVSVILMDVDNFKEVNDTYGHLVGDKLLSFLGQVISTQGDQQPGARRRRRRPLRR